MVKLSSFCSVYYGIIILQFVYLNLLVPLCLFLIRLKAFSLRYTAVNWYSFKYFIENKCVNGLWSVFIVNFVPYMFRLIYIIYNLMYRFQFPFSLRFITFAICKFTWGGRIWKVISYETSVIIAERFESTLFICIGLKMVVKN